MKYLTLESSHKSLSTQIAKRQKVAIVMSCTRVLLWQRHDKNTVSLAEKLTMPGSPMGPGAPVIPGKPINPVTPLSPLKKKKNL